MHFTLARMVPLISLLAQHSTWNIGWSHAPCPLADPNTCKFVRRRLLSHLPLTAWPILQRADSAPVVFSHWCRNLALNQHGSLSPSSRTRLLDSGIWSGSDQRNTFPT